jgi:trehalose/maltose hydrolase-like predicted phosphorylase
MIGEEVVDLLDGEARVVERLPPLVHNADGPSAASGPLARQGQAAAARFAADWLAALGVTGGLVLVVGGDFGNAGGAPGASTYLMVDELARAVFVSLGTEQAGLPPSVVKLGGGQTRLVELLEEQLAHREQRRVPSVDLDPAWVVPLSNAHSHERVCEALATLGNGAAALRGAREEDGPGTVPMFLVNGIYAADGHLLPAPVWTDLDVRNRRSRRVEHRWLDLRTGVLLRLANDETALRTVRFVSVAARHAMALRAEGSPGAIGPGHTPGPSAPEIPLVEQTLGDGTDLARTGTDAPVAVAFRDEVVEGEDRHVVERLAAWAACPDGPVDPEQADERLTEIRHRGFDRLLAEHRAAWAKRWADAEVTIEGDRRSELAARFAVFHLLSAATDTGEAAVGARGLTGEAYNGHVFWDADVFVLPAVAAIRPSAARAMLEYRLRRLPAARALARQRGQIGARFPWESAGDGTDVTPRFVRGRQHQIVPITTGLHEEHIVADVAWAADHYARWTGDAAFLHGPGRDLVVETARYWAGRVRLNRDGRGHIYGAEGPDEYHEVVDDNAYTNVMARWNLRRGADLLAGSEDLDGEADEWRALADTLVDGWDPSRGLYEQFAGYFDLEPLLVAQVAPPPMVADVLLGARRVAGSQIIKQVDTMLLHHLVPNEVIPGSLEAGIAFYEPRTAHGSSLSPAISASLLARAGQPDRALELFRLAAFIDLDDLTGTTAGGLHLAAMGGLWQALAWGFLGMAAEGDTLAICPRLPAAWSSLSLRCVFRGRSIRVRAQHDRVSVDCSDDLLVRIGQGRPRRCGPPGLTAPLEELSLEGARS